MLMMRYQLTKKELRKFYSYRIKRYKITKVLFAIFIVYSLLMGIKEKSPWLVLLFLIIFLFYYNIFIWFFSFFSHRISPGLLKETRLVLEHGYLKVYGDRPYAVPVEQITQIEEYKGLLLLSGEKSTKQERYLASQTGTIVIPTRIFFDQSEKEAFLHQLKSGIEEKNITAEPVYSFSFQVDENKFAHSMTALYQWNQKSLQRLRKRTLLYIVLIFIAELYMSSLKSRILYYILVPLILFSILCYFHKPDDKFYCWLIKHSKFYQSLLGEWNIQFFDESIHLIRNHNEIILDWKWIHRVGDFQGIYLFGDINGTQLFHIPKNLLENEKQAEFLRFCEAKSHRELFSEEPPTTIRFYESFQKFVPVIIILLLVSILVDKTNDNNKSSYDDFVFVSSDYPDYLPLESQVSILQELDLTISEEVIEVNKDQMENSDFSKVYIEGYPFYSILTELGMPEYDYESGDIISYSEQAYWFDYEGWDIATDYLEILKGTQALSGNDFTFTAMAEDVSDVNWEEGTGSILITFACNGTPYEYNAQVEHDWIDPDFLIFLSNVLIKEDCENHLYICSDNGQGSILFYRDEDWAEQFTEKTGIILETAIF